MNETGNTPSGRYDTTSGWTDEQAWGDALAVGKAIRDASLDMQRYADLLDIANARLDRLEAALRGLLDRVDFCTDEGPPGEEWKSDELLRAMAQARTTLGEPTEPPT